MFGTCTNVQVVEWLVGSFMHAHMPHACSCMVTTVSSTAQIALGLAATHPASIAQQHVDQVWG